MKILIYGGSGYLGSFLVEKFINKNFKVTIISNKKKKINKLVTQKTLEDLIKEKKINYFDIMICTAGVDSSNKVIKSISKINNIIIKDACKINNKLEIEKFIFLSSIHVLNIKKYYDNNNKKYLNYSKSKLESEKYLIKNLLPRTKLIILRISNIFGYPSTNYNSSKCWNLIINNLCLQAVKNNEIIINSKVNFRRHFFPISIFSETIVSLLEKKFNKKKNIFILISSKYYSLYDITKLIVANFKNKIVIKFNFNTTKHKKIVTKDYLFANKIIVKNNNIKQEIKDLIMKLQNA